MSSLPQQTSSLRLRRAVEADFGAIELREQEEKNLQGAPLLSLSLQAYLQQGTLGAFVDGDTVVALAGYYEPWPGLWEVFIYPSKHVPEYGMMFARYVRKVLHGLIKNRNKHVPVHRVQTEALDDRLHNRWMKFMGFTCDGLMRKYSPTQQDYKLWSIVLDGSSS